MSEPAPELPGGGGRDAAYAAVLDVLRGTGFAIERLAELRTTAALSGRDAGLAMQIALGTVRHLLTISHVIEAVARVDRRTTRPELRAILYTAAYQILWMDRVPVFAAVNEAVKQAHRYAGGRAPGMVNAVLRNVTRALADRRVSWQRLDPTQVRVGWDEACQFQRAVLPPADDVPRHLAAATGQPLQRFLALAERYGLATAEQISWACQSVPVIVLQRNRLRVGSAEFETALREALGAELPADAFEITPDVAYVPASTHVAELKPFREGWVFVQDPTAHAAALAVEAWPGERVLDLCAAPGGKSLVLALDMQNRGEVVACDLAPQRLARVEENAARLGLTCIHTRLPPSADAGAAELGLFDAVLLDVPCSNTGVIARRPEARLGLTPQKLQSLAAAQCELLTRGARHVRPGGRLVYSTCSIEPEENEALIGWFTAQNAEWAIEQIDTVLPQWGPRPSDWRDGGFVARLRRGG